MRKISIDRNRLALHLAKALTAEAVVFNSYIYGPPGSHIDDETGEEVEDPAVLVYDGKLDTIRVADHLVRFLLVEGGITIEDT